MDAKSKANFINVVATGEGIPCPKCDAMNKPDSKFCYSCGAELVGLESTAPESETPQPQDQETALPTLSEPIDNPKNESSDEQGNRIKKESIKTTYNEPESVFAQGLPSWSVEPPQIMVRRR